MGTTTTKSYHHHHHHHHLHLHLQQPKPKTKVPTWNFQCVLPVLSRQVIRASTGHEQGHQHFWLCVKKHGCRDLEILWYLRWFRCSMRCLFLVLQACVSIFDAHLALKVLFFCSLVSYGIVVVVVRWLTWVYPNITWPQVVSWDVKK